MRIILASTLLLCTGMTLCSSTRAQPQPTPTEPRVQTLQPSPTPAALQRDPFWPIGYVPKSRLPVAAKTTTVKQLTEEEMQALIKREQERIKNMIAVNGKIVRGNKWYVFINRDLLVTEGDVLEVDVDGVFYRLVIKALSENNIQLEPYRQNKPK